MNADLKAGGLDHVTQLVTGAGMAASGLTFWLAKERGVEVEALISQLTVGLPEGIPERDVVKMIETMLTGSPGVKQTADFLARLFDEDEERRPHRRSRPLLRLVHRHAERPRHQ
ncbi:hypothetical protein [Streptomyces sp. NPDC102437]|uniref:hypothetical protein n=1 Tax=Streptomyces sp. NPDC102437 TaxID=3366175 RepID=UPI003803C778